MRQIMEDIRCWCESQEWKIVFRTNRFGLLQCQKCSSYRIYPSLLINNDRDAKEFYGNYYRQIQKQSTCSPHHRHGKFNSRFWDVAKKQPDLMKTGDSVLDFGCGDGQLCSELQDMGVASVIGLDISQSRIEYARRQDSRVTFYDVPIEETEIPDDTFDLIVMDNVIEHLLEPLKVIRKLFNYLKPGGRIVIITPNMRSGHFRLLGRRWTPELAPHVHVFLFTPQSLRRIMIDATYQIESEGSFHIPFHSLQLPRLFAGDLKTPIWQIIQESGALYGHIIHSGPMLYIVAIKPKECL